jgi:hypothetical protein
VPGLVPGIHVFFCGKDMDGRDKRGHERGWGVGRINLRE